MYVAVMFTLCKRDGGIRPIAVGNNLRRLATKVGDKSISASIGEALNPVQLRVSSKGRCETAAHSARRYDAEALHSG